MRAIPPDQVARRMRLDNPWKEREARRHVQDYDDKGQGQGQDDAGDDDIPF